MNTYTTMIKSWVPAAAQWVMFGILYAICGDQQMSKCTDGATGNNLMTINCTESQYKKFEELVKGLYPDACVFDWEGRE